MISATWNISIQWIKKNYAIFNFFLIDTNLIGNNTDTEIALRKNLNNITIF